MHRNRWPAAAGILLLLFHPLAPVQACGIAASEAGTIKVTAGGEEPCDPSLLRNELKRAIAVSEATSAGGRGGGAGGRQGAYANQQRTTNSPLYKLGTAPAAEPPPTRMVMPGAR